MAYAIETVGLIKNFPRRRGLRQIARHPLCKDTITALNGVDLQVEEGELFGILGPNGAGKTTLIKLLSTLILPDAGEAWVNGYSIFHDEENIKRSIGLVTGEERSFYWRLSGRRNLEFFATLHNMSPFQAQKRINAILEILELQEKANDLFYTYSTGMKQELSLARGLINDPQILFVDEPTKSLDPVAAQNIRKLIREKLVKEQGKTVFLATHNLEEAQQMCDRLAILDRGRILSLGTPSEIRKTVSEEDRYILKVRSLAAEALEKIRRQKKVAHLSSRPDPANSSVSLLEVRFLEHETALPLVIETLVSSGAKILDCNHFEVPLEDVFAEVVKRKGTHT
ncbi:Daunorubicin/doxorubicin resistance ATP-binding protein DrrA [subsurface metagenome]